MTVLLLGLGARWIWALDLGPAACMASVSAVPTMHLYSHEPFPALSAFPLSSQPPPRRINALTIPLNLSHLSGVGFFYGGMVQHKNVVATIIQACIPMAIIPIVWSVVGWVERVPDFRWHQGQLVAHSQL